MPLGNISQVILILITVAVVFGMPLESDTKRKLE